MKVFKLGLFLAVLSTAQAFAENAPSRVKVTYIGTATILLEIGDKNPLRILTDPAMDVVTDQELAHGGREYSFFHGFLHSKKFINPALRVENLPKLDVVLISHHEHLDNLDETGKVLLPRASRVITTPDGAEDLQEELGLRPEKITGLNKWQSVSIKSKEGWSLTIHAVPAQHGEVGLPSWVVGDTTGFILEWPGQKHGPVYISGDTVYFDGISEIAQRFPHIGTAFFHLGGVRFPVKIAGLKVPLISKLRYTFDADDTVKAAKILNPQSIIPIHKEGWTHFVEPYKKIEKALIENGFGTHLHRLKPGVSTERDF